MTDLDNRFELRPNPQSRTAAERAAILAAPKFGAAFTDHMARMTWTAGQGWADRRVEAFAPLALSPAAAVLHYAQEIFEGLKAYRREDGSIWTFRPFANAERFVDSARRMALPELEPADFVASLQALVAADREWVPTAPETSLYFRPFMFAAEAFVGVRPATLVEYLVIASPVGAYFSGGVAPVTIWVEDNDHRAGPGGTGAAKCGGNYAGAMQAQVRAIEHGCDQVLFLDALTGRNIEELGGMNVFVVFADGTVATPELTGTFLEGITRSSIIQLLIDRGISISERPIPLEELITGIEAAQISEIFACGTAAVITPIGRLTGPGYELTIGHGQSGDLTMSLRTELTDIQYGRRPDKHGWTHRLV